MTEERTDREAPRGRDREPKEFAVLGDPIQHSLSPELFAFVFRRLGVPYRYRALRVPPGELVGVLERVRAGQLAGVNVTIPHKERVIPLLDGLDQQAERLGAVNTLALEGGKLKGYNTDIVGFSRSLQEAQVDLRGKRAVVLGAGGAARAVLFALVEMGVASITVGNRTQERAERLVEDATKRTGFSRWEVMGLRDPSLSEVVRKASLLVNATSLGMHPHAGACPLPDPNALHPGLVVMDLIYHPLETRLLREAAERGARTIDGLNMLIYQALEALAIWTQGALRWERSLEGIREHLRRKLQQGSQRVQERRTHAHAHAHDRTNDRESP